MGDPASSVPALTGTLPVVLVLALAAGLALVALGLTVRRRAAQRRLRERAGRELGLTVPGDVRVSLTREHRHPGAFLLAYPRWRYAHRDGTRDRRRLGNRVLRRWSVLEVGRWRLVSTDLFGLYDLVLQLRASGVAVACSQQELNKLRASEARGLARRNGSCLTGIVDAFAGCPGEFAPMCADLFRGAGYRVETPGPTTHRGFDLRLWRGGQRYIMACFCQDWHQPVDRALVHRLQEANVVEGADAMILVSTGPLSPEATAFATQVGIRIVDGDRLVSMFQRVWGSVEPPSYSPGSVVRLTRGELLIGFPADMRHRAI